MKNRKFRRIFAGVFAAAMAVTTPVMAAGTVELNDVQASGSATVKAHVAGADTVSYVIQIPAEVDFGTVKQPNSEGTSYVTEPITVTCTQLEGLQSGQVLSVLVKDSEAVEQSDPFKLKNANDIELTYNILTSRGDDIHTNTWYSNGFLFSTFTAAGQTATNTARLDLGQLYGKDLALYGGDYTGTLNFHSTISSIDSVS